MGAASMRLERITLRDFVIVPALELDMAAGFTALTGETGAGKSILIDAVQLALGARGDAGFVREGAHQADICLEFSTQAMPADLQAWLARAGFVHSPLALDVGHSVEHGMDSDSAFDAHSDAPLSDLHSHPGPHGLLRLTGAQAVLGRGHVPLPHTQAHTAQHAPDHATDSAVANNAASSPSLEPLLVRRTLDVHGRSRAWINGAPATIAQLRELGGWLIDIHGQHAWQRLMQPDAVRDLLDAWVAALERCPPSRAQPSSKQPNDLSGVWDSSTCAHAQDLHAAAQHWAAWQAARRDQTAAAAAAERAAHERERLAWQLEEIERLAPQIGEWSELNERHQRLTHARDLLDAATRTLDHLERHERSAQTSLSRAAALIDDNLHRDATLAPIAHSLQAAQTHLDDACHSLHGWLRQARLDPQELQRIDERVSQWLALARRWRCAPEDLPTLAAQWREQLAALDQMADLDTLAQRQREHRTHWQAAATRIRERRQRAAPQLSQAITAAMQNLGMTGGCFEVQLLPTAAAAHGADAVQLLVAGHPGAVPKPLAKVASGGELSRLALAIAVTTSALNSAGTLIFDEVDTGIGGAVAQTVGQLLRQLGHSRQVLVVTHLPQVAACAHQHWLVAKTRSKTCTYSAVTPLTEAEREAEIARMLSGQSLSPTSLAHAQELIATAKN